MASPGATFLAVEEAYKLLDSQKFTDFIIRCDGQDFHVHRLMIYHKSEFFRAIFDNEFREKAEGVLDLGETTQSAVATVILYCYIKGLATVPKEDTLLARLVTPSTIGESDKQSYVRDMTEVYVLSDRLLMKDLKEAACEAIFKVLDTGVYRAVRVRDDSTLLAKLMSIVQHMYDKLPTSDDVLRPVLTGWIVAQFSPTITVSQMLKLAKKEDHAAYTAARFAIAAQDKFTAKLVADGFLER